jgi:hypothetical protein
MPFPGVTYGQFLDNATAEELQQFAALIEGYLRKEHKDDGSHGDVTADSLTIRDVATGEDTGTVTGHFVPTVGNTYDLGGLHDEGLDTQEVRSWRKVYAGTSINLGMVETGGSPSGPVETPAWVDSFATGVRTTTNATTEAEWDINDTLAGTVATFCAPVDVGGAQQPGVLVPFLRATEATFVNGFFERERTTRVGVWTTPTFAAGDYTASGAMTWTVASGDVDNLQYMLVGKTLFVNGRLSTTSVGGTASTQLIRAIPGGFTSAKTTSFPALGFDNGTSTSVLVTVTSGGTSLLFNRADLGNWSNASTNNTALYFSVALEIQ